MTAKKIRRDHKEFGIRCKRERFIGMHRYIITLDHNSEGLKCLNADDSVVVCWLVMPLVWTIKRAIIIHVKPTINPPICFCVVCHCPFIAYSRVPCQINTHLNVCLPIVVRLTPLTRTLHTSKQFTPVLVYWCVSLIVCFIDVVQATQWEWCRSFFVRLSLPLRTAFQIRIDLKLTSNWLF